MRSCWGAAIALAILSGCTSDGSPVPTDPGAANTGMFPVFTVETPAAAPQLSEDQAEGDIARLESAATRAQRRAVAPMTDADMTILQRDAAVREAMVGMSEVERLRFLRKVHEERTLAQIEGGTS